MKEIWINLLNNFGLAWWVEIGTDSPRCTYYFGPFLKQGEAEAAKNGYIEDLEQEGAQGIRVITKRCKPTDLTVYDDRAEMELRRTSPAFSGQV